MIDGLDRLMRGRTCLSSPTRRGSPGPPTRSSNSITDGSSDGGHRWLERWSPDAPASSARTSPKRCSRTGTRCSASTASTTTTRAPTSARTSARPPTTTRSELRHRRSRRRSTPTRLLERCDVVFHLAASPACASAGASTSAATAPQRAATQRLLEASHDRACASSTRLELVYGDASRSRRHEDDAPRPLSPYGVTKLAAEHLCVLYGGTRRRHRRAALLLVYGPRERPDMAIQRFLAAIVAGEPIEVFGDGRQTRDFTYVGDIVAATRAAGETLHAARPGLQHRRRRARQRSPRARGAGGPRRAPARRPPRRARVRRRPATRAPTRTARATSRLRSRDRLGVRAAAELEWVRERTDVPRAKLDRFLTFARTRLEGASRYGPMSRFTPRAIATASTCVASIVALGRAEATHLGLDTPPVDGPRRPQTGRTLDQVVDQIYRLTVGASVAGEQSLLVGRGRTRSRTASDVPRHLAGQR